MAGVALGAIATLGVVADAVGHHSVGDGAAAAIVVLPTPAVMVQGLVRALRERGVRRT